MMKTARRGAVIAQRRRMMLVVVMTGLVFIGVLLRPHSVASNAAPHHMAHINGAPDHFDRHRQGAHHHEQAYTARLESMPSDAVNATRLENLRSCDKPSHVPPITDAVVTFVTADDSEFRESLRRYRPGAAPESYSRSRFDDLGELRYCLRGIAQHAPFVRRIFLVVSAISQIPEWLDLSAVTQPRVVVVTHDDMCAQARSSGQWPSLPECRDVLPTFNSNAIEALLPFIPGIAPHFLYFNNDMLLGNTVTPLTFIGCSRRRNSYEVASPAVFYESFAADESDADLGTPRTSATLFERKLAYNKRLVRANLGISPGGTFAHVPRLLSRKVMIEALTDVFGVEVLRTMKHRFRTDRDAAPIFLHQEMVQRHDRALAAVYLYPSGSLQFAQHHGCVCRAPSYYFATLHGPSDVHNALVHLRDEVSAAPTMVTFNDDFSDKRVDADTRRRLAKLFALAVGRNVTRAGFEKA